MKHGSDRKPAANAYKIVFVNVLGPTVSLILDDADTEFPLTSDQLSQYRAISGGARIPQVGDYYVIDGNSERVVPKDVFEAGQESEAA